jgi:hypothetical protein
LLQWGGVTSTQPVEASDTAKNPTMHRMAPASEAMWPQKSVMERLRNLSERDHIYQISINKIYLAQAIISFIDRVEGTSLIIQQHYKHNYCDSLS